MNRYLTKLKMFFFLSLIHFSHGFIKPFFDFILLSLTFTYLYNRCLYLFIPGFVGLSLLVLL